MATAATAAVSAAGMLGIDRVGIFTLCGQGQNTLDAVQKLLEVLKSDAFKNKLLELGGYGVHNPGTVREHF